MTKTAVIVWKYLFAVSIIVAACGLYIIDRQGLAFAVPPIAALYIAFVLILAIGVIVGAVGTWLICRGCVIQNGGRHAL